MVDIPRPTLRHANNILNKVLTIQNKHKKYQLFYHNMKLFKN